MLRSVFLGNNPAWVSLSILDLWILCFIKLGDFWPLIFQFFWSVLSFLLGLFNTVQYVIEGTSQVVLVVKMLPVNIGDIRDTGLIPGLGRSPGGGHGNPLQYSCLENPMDRGTWWATVHGVTKSGTHWSDLVCIHACISLKLFFFPLRDFMIFWLHDFNWLASMKSPFLLFCSILC